MNPNAMTIAQIQARIKEQLDEQTAAGQMGLWREARKAKARADELTEVLKMKMRMEAR